MLNFSFLSFMPSYHKLQKNMNRFLWSTMSIFPKIYTLYYILTCTDNNVINILLSLSPATDGGSSKGGRCPTRVLSPDLCPEGVLDQCSDDASCSGASKCCSTGCAKVCIKPLSSGECTVLLQVRNLHQAAQLRSVYSAVTG